MLGTLRRCGLDRLITSKPCREADLATAMIVSRLFSPGAKLANLTGLRPETAKHTLANELQLAVGEKKLQVIAAAVASSKNPLRGKAEIGLRVGRELKNTKMAKHFELQIQDDSFSFARREEQIAQEATLDGLYVIRTSAEATIFTAEQTVSKYKDLSQVEWAFRSLKTMDLQVRPIYHWRDEQIKAHVFLCMLAYYVEWHTRGALAELLFDDHQREATETTRRSIVVKAPRSEAAKNKETTLRTERQLPVQSFQSLIKDLGTLCKNQIRWESHPTAEFECITEPTPLKRRTFELLELPIAS